MRKQFLLGLLLLASAAVPAWAYEQLALAGRPFSPPPPITRHLRFGDWQAQCIAAGSLQNCAIGQVIFDSPGHAVLVNIALEYQEGHGLMMGITLPLTSPYKVALTGNLGLAIDSAPLKTYAFRTCRQDGCIASFPVNEALYNEFAGARSVKLSFTNLAGQTVSIPWSMTGYYDARRLLERTRR